MSLIVSNFTARKRKKIMGTHKESSKPNHSNSGGDDDALLLKWKNAILSILQGEKTSTKNKSKKANVDDDAAAATESLQEIDQQLLKVKKLRKLVFLSMQLDDDDDAGHNKSAKKSFKHTIQTLEMENKIHLDADGHVTLIQKKSKKKNTASNEKHPKKREPSVSDENNALIKPKQKKTKVKYDDDNDATDNVDHSQQHAATNENDDIMQQQQDGGATSELKKSNEPCVGNPQGITRLFIGNLSFQINETTLEEFLPGLTHVKWITDKATGKFYGSAFIEMLTSQHAANAITIQNGQSLLGRPIKINYAPALPGDHWPPDKKVITGGNTNHSTTTTSTGTATAVSATTTRGSKSAGGVGIQSMSSKPDNCCKLFIGNLSYEITDEVITKFFQSIDVEIKAVRWIHHKDSGDFKGVYVTDISIRLCYSCRTNAALLRDFEFTTVAL
jgi:nucleolin